MLDVVFGLGVGLHVLFAQRLLEPRREVARRVQPAAAKQLVARGDFDEDPEAAPRGHRHANERHPDAEDVVAQLVDAEPFVITFGIPPLELYDQFDALRVANGGDAEEIPDVDEAEAANLHVMPRQLRARANQRRFTPAPDFHRVVGDEPVPADDEVEPALALPDAAL